jgi:hypothetical protein
MHCHIQERVRNELEVHVAELLSELHQHNKVEPLYKELSQVRVGVGVGVGVGLGGFDQKPVHAMFDHHTAQCATQLWAAPC